jgi:hypothetical protein
VGVELANLTIHQNGRVTLRMDLNDFTSMLGDAAKGEASSTGNCLPMKQTYLAMAAVISAWCRTWHPDSADSELEGDVQSYYNARNTAAVPPTDQDELGVSHVTNDRSNGTGVG